jgi:hypothetical protein
VFSIRGFAAVCVIVALPLACSAPSPEASSQTAQPYAFHALTFEPQKTRDIFVAVGGSVEFILRDPDNPKKPTAWEGPLEIRQVPTGRPCQVLVSLITEVYLDNERSTALVHSYSGSRDFIDFVDVRTCATKWPQLAAVTERVIVSQDRLIMSPACESATRNRSRCTAGQVLRLQRDTPPMLLDRESRELTKDVVGVEFIGQAWVEGPKTPNAKIVSP